MPDAEIVIRAKTSRVEAPLASTPLSMLLRKNLAFVKEKKQKTNNPNTRC